MEWQVECLWTLLAIRQQSLKHETQSVARSLAVMGDNAGLCGEQRRRRSDRETTAARSSSR